LFSDYSKEHLIRGCSKSDSGSWELEDDIVVTVTSKLGTQGRYVPLLS